MNRVELIAQLAVLKKTYADTGETMKTLVAHFQAALDNRELAHVEEDGQVVAFCDWSWIESQEDVHLVNNGEHTYGPILHIINLVSSSPKYLWRLRGMLPKHQWISGERNGVFHAPKGLPQQVEA